MPWNDKSNPGPWGTPPGGGSGGSGSGGGSNDNVGGDKPKGGSPWTRPPQRPEQPRPPREPRDPRQGPSFKGPDVDALAAEARARLNRFFRGPNGREVRPQAVAGVAAGVLALWMLSGVYVVQPNEQAVVTRFGAYAGTAQPGLQYRLPWPIEAVEKVPVTSVQRTDVGSQAAGAGGGTASDGQMLTGDENLVDLDFTVQWRINNAAQYLFALENPDNTVRAVAESAMREVVGRTALDPIISTGRGRVQTDVAVLMQRVLDAYGAGVEIVEVQIRNAGPPAEVVPAFRAVASASQEAESRVNEATAYRNRVVNEAAGDAAQRRRAAEGYREQAIREAEGASARFNQVYTQYASAPDVTRRRLYLETMERVIRESRTVVLDSRGGASAPIILQPSTPAAPAAPAPAATPQPQAQASAR